MALVHRRFEGAPSAPANWQATSVEGQGWIFPFGQAAVVVTTRGVVRLAHPDQVPERALAMATVPNLSDIIEAARSSDAVRSQDQP